MLYALPCLSLLRRSWPLFREAGCRARLSTASSLTAERVEFPERTRDHYVHTVREDLMVMLYQHPTPDLFQTAQQEAALPLSGTSLVGQFPCSSSLPWAPQKIPNQKPPPVFPYFDNTPSLQAVDLHIQLHEAVENKYKLLGPYLVLTSVSGMRPEITYTQRNSAQYKVRKGLPIGCRVRMTGDRMHAFMNKLVELVLPRIKEWPGLPLHAGDSHGNVTLRLHSQAMSAFPDIEVMYDAIPAWGSMDVTFHTTATRSPQARTLLSAFQIPFMPSKNKKNQPSRKPA